MRTRLEIMIWHTPVMGSGAARLSCGRYCRSSTIGDLSMEHAAQASEILAWAACSGCWRSSVHGCRRALACGTACLLALTVAGCHQVTFHDRSEPVEPAVAAGADFDSAQCGTVSGEVLWDGEVP